MFIKFLDKWVSVDRIKGIAVNFDMREDGVYKVYAGTKNNAYAFLYGKYPSKKEAFFAMNDLAERIKLFKYANGKQEA